MSTVNIGVGRLITTVGSVAVSGRGCLILGVFEVRFGRENVHFAPLSSRFAPTLLRFACTLMQFVASALSPCGALRTVRITGTQLNRQEPTNEHESPFRQSSLCRFCRCHGL